MAKKKKQPRGKPEQPPVRLLHKRSHRGYTEDPNMAMFPDAGEAVDSYEQEYQTAEAKRKAEARRTAYRQAQELLPMERRIAELQQEAKRRRVNIRDEMRLIEKLKREGRPMENPVRTICTKLDKDLDCAA